MSLLPNQVLPETVPIGTVNPDGTVTITHTWYLLLYNMGLMALPNNNTYSILEAETFLPRVTPYNNPDPAGTQLQTYSFAPRQYQSINYSVGNSSDILMNQVFGA